MRFEPEACPECGEEDWEILHEAHPGAPRTDATLRCASCSHTMRGAVEWPKDLQVKCVVSAGRESKTSMVTVPSDERIRVGEELLVEGRPVLVTSIEHKNGRRVKTAPPDRVRSLWAKVFDILQVPVSVNLGPTTAAHRLALMPDEPVHVGDVVELEGRRVRVDHIKTEHAVVHRGAVPAREIVRLYAKPVDGVAPDAGDAGPGHGHPGGRPSPTSRPGQ